MTTATTPEESVLDKSDWQTNQIASSAGSLYKAFFFFGLVWNSILGVILFFMWDSLANTLAESPILYVFILFPIVGVFVFYLALKHFAAWKKFGSTPFVMDPFPGQVGGKVGGYVDLPVPFDPTKIATVVISCMRHEFVKNDDSDSEGDYHVEVLWESEKSVILSTSSIGSRIQFLFEIPQELPDSELESELFHDWVMQVNLPLKGMDFLRTFEIPVMKQSSSSSDRYRH